MEEKVYRTMGSVGAANITLGIIMAVAGVACGVIAIISGARLFRRQKDLTF